jgi:predicted RNase H-like HicB family nuclease
MKTTYTVILSPERAGGSSVSIPAFESAVTQGDTFEQAMENALDVIELFLATYADEGIDIPVEPGLSLAVGLQVEVPVAVAATAA